MTDLSPAAQSVLDAFRAPVLRDCPSIAGAIRALADQVIPVTQSPWGSTLVPVLTATESRERILAIADELEGLDND